MEKTFRKFKKALKKLGWKKWPEFDTDETKSFIYEHPEHGHYSIMYCPDDCGAVLTDDSDHVYEWDVKKPIKTGIQHMMEEYVNKGKKSYS